MPMSQPVPDPSGVSDDVAVPRDPSAWDRLHDRTVDHFRIFSVRRSAYRHAREGRDAEFIVIDAPDWVNVVALTPERRIVLVRQFRFGRNDFFLEVPGGAIETGEDPVVAGQRELREETGFAGGPARVLGRVHPNPAILSNVMHIVLVENVVAVGAPSFDVNEEVETALVPLDEAFAMAADGRITHALVLDALFHLRMWLDRSPTAGASGPAI